MHWWRKALVVCLMLLLVISGVLFLRLNPERLGTSIRSQLQQGLGWKIMAGPASLSLLGGASLRIQDVGLEGKGRAWRLHADSIRIGLSPWSLLQGKARAETVDIIRPVLTLPKLPSIKHATSVAWPTSLMQIRIRQGRIQIAGSTVSRKMDGMVRRINGEKELTWELQSKFLGGDVSSQGRIRYRARNYPAVFGKIHVRRIALSRLPENMAAIHFPFLAYGTLDSTLTFDVHKKKAWSVFGDATFHAKQKSMPPMLWRGEISGKNFQQFAWHDAFLQLGQKTMLAITGGCAQKQGCNFGIHTRNAEIPLILEAVNLHWPVKGTLDATSSFSWKGGQWSATGKLVSHHISWSGISVPDVAISVPDARYHAPEHFELANMRLQSAATKKSIVLDKFIKSGKRWSLDAHAKNIADGWVPLTNILLKSYGMAHGLRGKGTLTAELHASASADHTGFDFSLDGSRAQLGYAEKFEKPGGIRASISAHINIKGSRASLLIRDVKLGNSHAEQVQWMLGKEKPEWLSAKRIWIDLSELKQDGIIFPAVTDGWHGAIRGRFSRVRPVAGTPVAGWFSQSGASFQLRAFGPKGDSWDGLIGIRNGELSTRNLRWGTVGQHAHLDGTINLASGQGDVNLRDAALSWGRGDTWPAWLAHAKLHGRLHNINLDWMENAWDGLHGTYRTDGQHIILRKIHGRLAGGSIQSSKISLVLMPAAVRFSGNMRMATVRLSKLRGFSEALGANLGGYMYLNANLEGELPWRIKPAWQGNGDIEIQHGHWQSADKKLEITVGDLRLKTGEKTPFSHFTTRFYLKNKMLRLTRMRLKIGEKRIVGHAFLYPNGAIRGNLKIRDGHGVRESKILGNWPQAAGFFGTK